MDKEITIFNGDCIEILKTLPESSVDLVVTSPPYYGQRDYDEDGQIGQEESPEHYLDKILEVLDGLWRVLKPTGTIYWNMDDSIREKKLLLLPQRFAIAADSRGWIVRQSIVWDKLDRGFPHRRPDCFDHFWEPILMLVKQKEYYFDQSNARVPNQFRSDGERRLAAKIWAGTAAAVDDEGLRERAFNKAAVLGGDRNFTTADGASLRNQEGKVATDIWRMSSTGYPGAHTATFPEAMVERCVTVSAPPRWSGSRSVPRVWNHCCRRREARTKSHRYRVEPRLYRHRAGANPKRRKRLGFQSGRVGLNA